MCGTASILKRFFSANIVVSKTRNVTPIKMSYISYEETASSSNLPSPLVIMHGLFGSKSNWNSLCKALLKNTNPTRKVLAVDARNHGDSPHTKEHNYEAMAHDVKALVDSQRLDKVNLLGHSMGGRTMMLFALKWPQYVDKLIIIDISPISNSASIANMKEYFNIMQSLNLKKDLPLSTARVFADAHIARFIPDKGIRAFLLTNLLKKPDGSFAWRVNVPVLKECYDNISQFSHLVKGMKYDGPTLFLAGGASDYIQKTDYKAIKEIFTNAQFQTIEGAGHWLHSEKPNEFIQHVVNFLNIT